MKVSLNWLNSFFTDYEIDKDIFVKSMFAQGFCVDNVESVEPVFMDVVVGYVVKCCKHPNADTLKVCVVDVGSAIETQDLLTIVCGAPNIKSGIKVPVALVGAKLSGICIKSAKIRGVVSQGMICSEKELSLGKDSDGIMILDNDADIGEPIEKILKLNDEIFEIEVTPNRGDCLSMLGIAREIAIALKIDDKLCLIQNNSVEQSNSSSLKIDNRVPHLVPNYICKVIKNVNMKAETPFFVKNRLALNNIGTMLPVVDILNYVMLLLGQPMHVFDLDKIVGNEIRVRLSEKGEKIFLLNGEEIELNDDAIVIADKNEPMALAGIMGGVFSSVNVDTKDIVLESAYFDYQHIGGTVRKYSVSSDSSSRFEKGVDFKIQKVALDLAVVMILKYLGGSVDGEAVSENYDYFPVLPEIDFFTDEFFCVSGFKLDLNTIKDILQRLKMSIISCNDNHLKVIPPSYRFDIRQSYDLIEEILRVYGYENVPCESSLCEDNRNPNYKSISAINEFDFSFVLTSLGYKENINYSFIGEKYLSIFGMTDDLIRIKNCMSSEADVMRISLVPGLFKNLEYHFRRQMSDLKIFEIGKCFFIRDVNGDCKSDSKSQCVDSTDSEDGISYGLFLGDGNEKEIFHKNSIAGLVTGDLLALNWSAKSRQVDFFDVKNHVEHLLNLTKIDLKEFVWKKTSDYCWLHPMQAAEIVYNGSVIGVIGSFHPLILQKFQICSSVFVFELSLDKLYKLYRDVVYEPYSIYPSVTRDLSFVVDNCVLAGDLVFFIKKFCGNLLIEVNIFDVYLGSDLGDRKKSLGFRLKFCAVDRTLEDKDVDVILCNLIKSLSVTFNAKLRDI